MVSWHLVLAGALAIFGLVVIAANGWAIFENHRRHVFGLPGHVSFVPLVGPMMVTGAWILARPSIGANLVGWVGAAWALDVGTWSLGALLITALGDVFRSKSKDRSGEGRD